MQMGYGCMTETFKTAFSALPTPCAVIGANGQLDVVNDSFAALLGCSVDSLTGVAAEQLLEGLPSELSIPHHGVLVDLKLGGTFSVRMGCSLAPLPDGGAVVSLCPAPEMAGWPYQLIVEAIQGGITIRDEDGRIIGSNAAARKLLGHNSSPAFIGRDGEPLAPREHPAFMALDSGNPVAAVIGLRQDTNHTRWLQVHSAPIRHPLGGRAVVSSFSEINQLVETQRLLADSERRFRAIFEHTFEFIGLLDTQGHLIEANATALAFIGKKLDEVVGQHFADTPWWSHSATERATLRDGIEQAAQGRFVRFETSHPGADGSVATVDFSLKPVCDETGQVIYIIPEGRDISHLKRAETELTTAKLQAEAANRAKSAFLATMSHELRTPLNAVIGFSETIIEQVFGPLANARYGEYVSLIHSAGCHLRDIIEDVLDVARIEIGEMSIQEDAMDLAPCLESALAMIRPKATERHVRLDVSLPAGLPRLRADGLRLRQIALNLLSNAVKFTPPGGSVRLAARADDSGLSFSVADTGIGIRPEDMDVIWTPFFQVEGALSRQFGGTGLGLPIVRHYVERHGGTIVVDSTPGQGSTFTVRLPPERLILAANDAEGTEEDAKRG